MRGLLHCPRLLLDLCALFWAGNFVLGRAMHETVSPIGLAFWRWAAACVPVLPFVWRRLLQQWNLLRSRLFRLSLLALLAVSGFNALVYLGLQTTTATNSVLIQSTMPVFGSLMAVAFLGEVFAWYHAAWAALVAAGILLMLLKPHPDR